MMVWKVCQLARPNSALAVAFSIFPDAMVEPLRFSLETEMWWIGSAEEVARMVGGVLVVVVVVVRLKVRERRKMMKRAPRMVERARLLRGMGEEGGGAIVAEWDDRWMGREEGDEDDEGEVPLKGVIKTSGLLCLRSADAAGGLAWSLMEKWICFSGLSEG